MPQEKTPKYFCRIAEIIRRSDIVLLEHTREEVLGDLEGTNHQNIRNFMKSGWDLR
jgi:hypothetical protein